MKLPTCQIARCNDPALWVVATEGHPNVTNVMVQSYCTAHVFVPTWDESPVTFKITITGPHKDA